MCQFSNREQLDTVDFQGNMQKVGSLQGQNYIIRDILTIADQMDGLRVVDGKLVTLQQAQMYEKLKEQKGR